MKRHKEQQVELAEQELKQVKLEIRTDKLKSVATDAATAIASGVGSLFGSGKLKELEYSNSELQLEIVKRDKSIDDLKAQMQHMQEQHSKRAFILPASLPLALPAAVFQLSGWMLCFVLNWQSLPSMVMRAIIITSPFFFSEPFFK